jgi:hypothetical protein
MRWEDALLQDDIYVAMHTLQPLRRDLDALLCDLRYVKASATKPSDLETMLRHALQIARKVVTANDRDLWDVLDDLVVQLAGHAAAGGSMEELLEAVALYRESVTTRSALHGEESDQTLESMTELASALLRVGQPCEAESWARRVVQALECRTDSPFALDAPQQKSRLNSGSSTVQHDAMSVQGAAVSSRTCGCREVEHRGGATARRAEDARNAIVPALILLATTLQEQGDLAAALKTAHRALQVAQAGCSIPDMAVGNALKRCGLLRLLLDWRRLSVAVVVEATHGSVRSEAFSKPDVSAIAEVRVLHDDDWSTRAITAAPESHGLLWTAPKDADCGLEHLRQALMIHERTLGRDAPVTRDTARCLISTAAWCAKLLFDRTQFVAAHPLLEQLCAVNSKFFGESDPNTKNSCLALQLCTARIRFLEAHWACFACGKSSARFRCRHRCEVVRFCGSQCEIKGFRLHSRSCDRGCPLDYFAGTFLSPREQAARGDSHCAGYDGPQAATTFESRKTQGRQRRPKGAASDTAVHRSRSTGSYYAGATGIK